MLPQTAILLYMSGLDYIKEKYDVQLITDRFPRFLNACPIYKIKRFKMIFVSWMGDVGAPMAADTIEVLKVMGSEKYNFVLVLIGGFVENINIRG